MIGGSRVTSVGRPTNEHASMRPPREQRKALACQLAFTSGRTMDYIEAKCTCQELFSPGNQHELETGVSRSPAPGGRTATDLADGHLTLRQHADVTLIFSDRENFGRKCTTVPPSRGALQKAARQVQAIRDRLSRDLDRLGPCMSLGRSSFESVAYILSHCMGQLIPSHGIFYPAHTI